jgi:hypothetical protein
MRIPTLLRFVSICLLAVGMSCLGAAELPHCNTNAPCFAIANRLGTVGLAVKTSSVASVYRNGSPLTKADYHVEIGARSKVMVIVQMPANTTGRSEVFQVLYSSSR